MKYIYSELFKETSDCLRYSNLSQEEWQAVRSLADERSIVIKKADKGSCVVVWDRFDYVKRQKNNLRMIRFMMKLFIIRMFFLSW